MSIHHPDRRQVLTAAGAGLVAAAGMGGGAASAAPGPSRAGSGLTGGWLITRHDKGTPGRIRGVLTLADGGVFVGADIDPASPPYLGSWEAEDNHRFVATFWTAITDAHGRTIGTGRIKANGRVDGNKMSGSYTDVVFIQDQEQHGSGTFRGVRIDPD